jgi:hypothetical protein
MLQEESVVQPLDIEEEIQEQEVELVKHFEESWGAWAPIKGVSSKHSERGRTDPFIIDATGQVIGHDGFRVPQDFNDFFERYPKYITNWVKRRMKRLTVDEDVEDWSQDLALHMKFLPATSKHREQGKEDVIQTFDPYKFYGANEARFRSYVNMCLNNKFLTTQSRSTKNPVCRVGNLSLSGTLDPEDYSVVDDEYCHSNSEYLGNVNERKQKQRDDRMFTEEFRAYVEQEDPRMVSVIRAIMVTQTQKQAAEELGVLWGCRVTDSEFVRHRNHLKKLAATWQQASKRRARLKLVQAQTTNKEAEILSESENMSKEFVELLLEGTKGVTWVPDPTNPERPSMYFLVPFEEAAKLKYGQPEICPWANPRVGFRNLSSVKKSNVAKDIRDAAFEKRGQFHILNGGAVLVADECHSMSSEGDKVELRFRKDRLRGVADGGTTIQTINDVLDSGFVQDGDPTKRQYFRVEVRCGDYSNEEAALIAEKLNTRVQVDDFSLSNLRGNFEWINEALTKGKQGYPQVPEVKYFYGDTGLLDVEDIIKLVCLFATETPHLAYTSKGSCLEFHNKHVEECQQFAPVLVDLLWLYEYIPLKLESVYGKDKFRKLAPISDSLQKRSKKLPFTQYEVDFKSNDAMIFPLVAALKPALNMETMTWKVHPDVIFEAIGTQLFDIIVATYRAATAKTKWSSVGRDLNLYGRLAEKVEFFVEKHLAKKAAASK